MRATHENRIQHADRATAPGADVPDAHWWRQMASRLRAALEMSTDAILFLTPPGLNVVDVNGAACAALGHSRSELLRMRLPELVPAVAEGPSAAAIDDVVRGTAEQALLPAEIRHTAGVFLPVEISIRRADCDCRDVLIAVTRDMSDKRRLEALAAHDALRDGLTGLANRTLLECHLARALQAARCQNEYRCAALFIDLDGFKAVNDAMGHLTGDRLLRAVAQRLACCVRPGDLVARFGGDEFVVFVEAASADREKTLELARRIRETLSSPIAVSGRAIRISASVGIAFASERHRTADDLIQAADRAMYRAKNNRKSRQARQVPGSCRAAGSNACRVETESSVLSEPFAG